MTMGDLALYNQHREQMKTGDMLLWANQTPLGLAIRHFSKAPVNHASTIAALSGYRGKRIFTVEALEGGVVPNYLSSVLENYNGEVWWYPLSEKWDFDEFRGFVEDNMFRHIGVGYDVASLLKNAVTHVQADDSKLFCSEDVYLDYGFAGIAPTPGEMPSLGLHKDPIQIMRLPEPVNRGWHDIGR